MIPFISVISTGNAVADPRGPTPAYFQSKLGPEGPKPKKCFLETSPPPPPLSNGLEDRSPPLISRSGSGNSMLRWHPGGEGGGYSHTLYYYTGMCRPTGLWFWSFWFGTLYPFLRCFLERGIIFRTHESSSLVSGYLKLLKDRLLLKNTVQCVNKQTVVLLLHPAF